MTRYEPLFAKYYDYLVHDRREALATGEDVSFVKDAFSTRCARTVHDILDVGCGTGRYLIPLTEAGFRVTGIDSSPEMLAHCHARLQQRNLQAALVELEIMQMDQSNAYDAVLCMDSTLCYLTETEDILKALSLFEHALRPGGLLVLEIFNPFVDAASRGTPRTREIRDNCLLITAKEYDWHDPLRSVRHGTLHVTVADGDQQHVFSREEVLRVMTAAETTGYLKEAGFAEISCELRKDTLAPESGDEDLVFLALVRREKETANKGLDPTARTPRVSPDVRGNRL